MWMRQSVSTRMAVSNRLSSIGPGRRPRVCSSWRLMCRVCMSSPPVHNLNTIIQYVREKDKTAGRNGGEKGGAEVPCGAGVPGVRGAFG